MPLAGPSLPKNYQLIRDVVEACGIGCHLTPSEIHAKVRERQPGIGLTTVYRGLERLRDLGLISEITVPGADAVTYEPAGPPHAHFRCGSCGTVEDVAFTIPVRTLKALSAQHGLRIDYQRVTFEGRCARCSDP
jgi:Fur family transcriptional regulator, ferric uptake regulator